VLNRVREELLLGFDSGIHETRSRDEGGGGENGGKRRGSPEPRESSPHSGGKRLLTHRGSFNIDIEEGRRKCEKSKHAGGISREYLSLKFRSDALSSVERYGGTRAHDRDSSDACIPAEN